MFFKEAVPKNCMQRRCRQDMSYRVVFHQLINIRYPLDCKQSADNLLTIPIDIVDNLHTRCRSGCRLSNDSAMELHFLQF